MKSDEPIIGPESTSFINPRIEAKGRIEFLSHHKGQFFFFFAKFKTFYFLCFNLFFQFFFFSSNLNLLGLANDFYIIIVLLLMSKELLGRSVTETCF